jgi:CheY-like chemotaxis protein
MGPEAAAEWLPLLGERAEVRVVTAIAEVQAALREQPFDVVLCPSAELLPLTSAAGRDQARMILDGIAQGVCVVDRGGKLLWSNTALQAYSPEVVEAIRTACTELLPELAAAPAQTTRQRSLEVGQQHFELTASGLRDAAGQLDRVVSLVHDTTSLTRMRAKLDAIDAAGRELVALDVDATARLEVPERLQLLEDNLIRYCRDLLNFTHFSVRVLDPKTNRLDMVLAGGFSEQARVIPIYARPAGNGISGYVAATGQSYICPDITQDPLYLPGLECARSSLTVPLRLSERVVGVLNVESDQPAAFTAEDRQVAEIFARYIAVALQLLKLLVVERSETTGQLAADVRAELAQPLNDIVAEATHLLQGSPGSEEIQRRLHAIIDYVDRVKETLQAMTTAPAIRGLAPEAGELKPALQGKRILVADDEEIIRETVADVLSKAGALPVMASDGDEAIAMIRAQHFDLVLSDIKMPNKNGYEVFAATKQVDRNCPVILITGFGYDPEHSIVRASREGLAGVLFKPFKVDQLLELIEKAVGAASVSADST